MEIQLPILREGAEERKRLDSLQGSISEVQTTLAAVERLPMTAEETRERLLQAIKAAVFNFGPKSELGEFRAHDGAPVLPRDLTFADFAFFLGEENLADTIVKRLEVGAQGKGIQAEARTAKIKELRKKLDELERAEEIETLRLEDAGHTILRRETARPELLMKIWAENDGAEIFSNLEESL